MELRGFIQNKLKFMDLVARYTRLESRSFFGIRKIFLYILWFKKYERSNALVAH